MSRVMVVEMVGYGFLVLEKGGVSCYNLASDWESLPYTIWRHLDALHCIVLLFVDEADDISENNVSVDEQGYFVCRRLQI